ncbi:MAG TPA: hypothetical protein VEV65_12715 [Kineosporiaceae bacterium]|nr:hypothetical protein [Kineosporiaceae bacterium]
MPEPDSTPGGNRPGEEPEEPLLRSTRLPAASASTVPSSHTTPSSAENQDARATELRDALDALRASLEGRAERAAPPAPPRPRRRPGRGVLLAAAVVVLAGVGVIAIALAPPPRRTAGPPPSASPVATAAAPSSSAGEPSSSPSASPAAPASPTPGPGPSLTTRPLPWPGGAVLQPPGLAASGPGATAPGLDVTAALDPDGRHVDVYERLLLRPGSTTLVLQQADLGALPAARLVGRGGVSDLQVELDGRPVRPQPFGGSWRAEAPGGGGITRAVLRYRLAGVLLRQAPAPPGRFTLVLRPLGAGPVLAGRDPVVVRIEDSRIGTMSCPTSRHPLCGSVTGRTHTATLPGDATAVVLAQVTRR